MTRIERLATFLVLRTIHALNTVQGTSPTTNPETEPHQPRVGTGKSPVGEVKLRS